MRAVELIESFLPLGLLSRIQESGSALPASLTFSAAVMFVDVSRYTALVEQFARRGSGGLEQIPGLLGRSYERCVEIIHEYNGEVVFVVGDAVLSYWADDEGLAGAVRNAAACAASICGDNANWPDGSARDDTPGFHIGVGAGRVWTAALGGQPLWNLVVGGEAITQAARAQERAYRWSYELSPEAAHALQENDHAPPRSHSQFAARETRALAPEWLAGFLPPLLREAVWNVSGDALEDTRRRHDEPGNSVSFDRLAEIRPVTALFARIVGLDPHEPHALERHHALCVALQDDLHTRGGPAGELYFDDKGLIFAAVFGTRGSFHRDDASRAVDAARAILTTVERLGLSTSLGIATGEALFRVIGNARRRQLLILGTHMNRAARLMTASPSGILCDAPTERASRAAFSFERRGNFHLAGLGETAPAFYPVERRVGAPLRVRPVGRSAELAELRAAFSDASSGASGLVVVMGEPGIGKTTLIQAFADALQASAAVVYVAPVERGDRQASLLPWRRVIASLLKLEPNADGPTVLAAIAANVKGQPLILGRLGLLDGILGVDIPQGESVRHLEGPHRADATMRLIGDLIAALAPRPVAIALDNSQWLDSASWRLVEWALASVPSLLAVVCVRSGEEPDELKSLRRKLEASGGSATDRLADGRPRFCRILDLAELDSGSMSGVVSRALGEAPADSELVARIAQLSAGNPLFAEEIALTLKARALIVVRRGFWRSVRPLDPFQFFEGVERVIRERVDRLEGGIQSMLRAAAVIGRSFAMESLAALMEGVLERDAVDAAVELLAGARLVRPGLSPGQFEFRHDQICDVVYNSTPSDLRRRLHGTLAEWMEREQQNSSVSEIVVLAQHFEASGDAAKAVKYADLAATKALQLGAYREVRAFIGICLGQESRKRILNSSQKLEAVRWRRQLGEAHYNLGDLNAQGTCVREALTLAGEPVPEGPAALMARLMGGGARLLLQQVIPAAYRPRDDANDMSWEQELTRCLNLAAVVDYFELRFTRSFCHTVIAATHGERTGASVERAVASAQLACGLGLLGGRRAAQYFMDRAERTVLALGDHAVHARICILDALWRMGECEWGAIDRRLGQAEDLCTTAGDQLSWCNVHALRFWSLYYRGDFAALEHTAHALLSRAQNSGNLQQETWALRCKALSLIHFGSPREAAEILRVNAEATRGMADLAERISSTGTLALALSRVGLHGESVEAAVETVRMLDLIGRPTVHSVLPGVAGAVEVLLRGRESGLALEYGEWRQWERKVLHHLDRFRRAFPLGESQYGLWMGVASWQDGRKEHAISIWRRALGIAQRRSLGHDEALIASEIRRRQYEPSKRSGRVHV